MKHCDLCGKELEPVFADLGRRKDDDQLKDCLHLVFVGGYGEYLDNLFGDYHFRLCKTCADRFMQNNKVLARLIEERIG